MSTNIGSSVLGLFVISLSFISPWGKSPDPVCSIHPDYDMCPPIPTCTGFNSSTKILIQEEIDKRTNNLNVGLEARIQVLENFTKVVNMSVIDGKMRELQKDTNAFTESRIKDVVESLNVSLNKSTENILQVVIDGQNKMFEKIKKVEEDFKGFREDTGIKTAECEQRYKEFEDKLKELKQDVNESTENRIKDAVEGLNSALKQTENQLQELLQEQTRMKENLKKMEDDFEKYKQVTNDTIARVEQRCKDTENEMKKVKKEVDASIEERINDVSETLNARLKKTENRFQEGLQEQNKSLENMKKKVEEDFQRHKQTTNVTIAQRERRCKARLRNTRHALNRILDNFYNNTLDKFALVEAKQELVYRVIEHMNLMRASTWGVFLILSMGIEVALFLYVCFFLNNRKPRLPEPRPPAQVVPPFRIEREDNNTLCIVYFVDRDLEQVRRWTDGVIEESHAVQRMRTINHLIASRHDIENIPTCRLALVFVNPDERQLILEDEFHMGSTRRDTVQSLRNKGAEVILIVYGDPTSKIRVLDDGLLLDSSLTQVTSHPVLKNLNSGRRILSLKESFSVHQKRHLVDTIDEIFA